MTGAALRRELLVCLGVALIGAAAFLILGMEAGDGGPLAGDRRAYDAIDSLRGGGLTALAKVLTNLGSSPVAALVVVATALWARAHGRTEEATALPLAFLALLLAVHFAKLGYDRPRPAHPLITTGGQAYPSGHSAYATLWIACAAVLVRGGHPRARGARVLIAALAIAVVVLFTRVYLHAHYLSDVLGGAGLGLAILGLAGSGTVIARCLRHNARGA